MSVSFKSTIRIRPLKSTEISQGEVPTVFHDASAPHTVTVEAPAETTKSSSRSSSIGGANDVATHHTFHYDKVLPPTSTQTDVFTSVGEPIVSGSISSTNPTNSVLFSFGVSNSGKTYTLMGPSGECDDESRGLIPRVVDGLFSNNNDLELTLSVLEVYNDLIYDLLPSTNPTTTTPSTPSRRSSSLPPPPPKSLKIHQDAGGFYVHNLSSQTFTSSGPALLALTSAMNNNTTSATAMNSGSSRGHTVVILGPKLKGGTNRECGQIMMVDMAGLERTKKSSVFGKSMRESANINQSISRVTAVLKALKHNNNANATGGGKDGGKGKSDKNKRVVPWRESKLTMLLQPVLGGGKDLGIDTNVTMLVSAYQGGKDNAEKVGLMKEVEGLRGIKIKGDKTPSGRSGVVSRIWGRRVDTKDKGGEEDTSTPKQTAATPGSTTQTPRRGLNSPAVGGGKKRSNFVDARTQREMDDLRSTITEQRARLDEYEVKERGWDEERLQLVKERDGLRLERDKILAEKEKMASEIIQLNKELKAERGIHSPKENRAARKARLKKQELVGSPLRQHIKAVMNSSALKDNNGRAGFKGLKGFTLNVPKEGVQQMMRGVKRERAKEEGGEEVKKAKKQEEEEDNWVNCM